LPGSSLFVAEGLTACAAALRFAISTGVKIPRNLQRALLFSISILLFVGVSCSKKAESTSAPVPAAPMDRYAWNLKTLVEPYQTARFADPNWDDTARRALAGFAAIRCSLPETNGSWFDIIATNCAAAVRAGCKDPMISYLALRYSTEELDQKTCADRLCRLAVEMKNSSYPPVRKFYAVRRAVQQYYQAYGWNADRGPLQAVGGCGAFVSDTLADPSIPLQEAYEVAEETLDAYDGVKDIGQYRQIYAELENVLFARWPDDCRPWLLKGRAYQKMAWIERGTGYADTVTAQGWEGMNENLAVAEQALERAWEINPNEVKIPIRMIGVELGQGKGRDRMELWFQRGMKIDTNSIEVCKSKLYYLEPKWYGSESILITFGRECIESKEWGGRVPLTMLDVHEAIANYRKTDERTNYWKQTSVWLDVRDAFERFFELNPDARGWYHNYAWYAARAERWDKVQELLPKFGRTNYSYFGGKEKFDEIVRMAASNGPVKQQR
jgi:hypothetical protein